MRGDSAAAVQQGGAADPWECCREEAQGLEGGPLSRPIRRWAAVARTHQVVGRNE
jgi:hypothetical protein